VASLSSILNTTAMVTTSASFQQAAASNDTSWLAAGAWHWHQEQHWGTCVAPGLHCGSPGARSRHCCGGVPCVESPGESGVKRCLGGYAMSNEAVDEIASFGFSEEGKPPLLGAEASQDQSQDTIGTEDMQGAADWDWLREQVFGNCVAPGEHCGGHGAQSRNCCGSVPCIESPGESGLRRCLGWAAMSNEAAHNEQKSEGGAPQSTDQSQNTTGAEELQAAADWHWHQEKHWGTCVAPGLHCGSPGARSRHCCGGVPCIESPGESGVKRCLGGYAMSIEAVEEISPKAVTENAGGAEEGEHDDAPDSSGLTQDHPETLPEAEEAVDHPATSPVAKEAIETARYCRKEHDACGGPGHLPLPCCGSLQCKTSSRGDRLRFCV